MPKKNRSNHLHKKINHIPKNHVKRDRDKLSPLEKRLKETWKENQIIEKTTKLFGEREEKEKNKPQTNRI